MDWDVLNAARNLCQDPWSGWTGPACLSSALALLGIDAPAEQVFAATRLSAKSATRDGASQNELVRAAAAQRVHAEIKVDTAPRGSRFASWMEAQLERGLPTVLSVDDHRRWVAVLGRRETGAFVVMDPRQERVGFSSLDAKKLLKRALARGDAAPYLGLFLGNARTPARFRISEEMFRFANRNGQTAGLRIQRVAGDLRDMLRRAEVKEVGPGVPVADLLREEKALLVAEFDAWWNDAVRESSNRDLATRLERYVAMSSCLTHCNAMPSSVRSLVRQLAVINGIYA